MRGHVARKAFALGSAGLMALAIAGCNQSTPEEEASQTNLKIVEKVQIDENGAEVKAAEGAAPANPAGDGKATCPPVSIAIFFSRARRPAYCFASRARRLFFSIELVFAIQRLLGIRV